MTDVTLYYFSYICHRTFIGSCKYLHLQLLRVCQRTCKLAIIPMYNIASPSLSGCRVCTTNEETTSVVQNIAKKLIDSVFEGSSSYLRYIVHKNNIIVNVI